MDKLNDLRNDLDENIDITNPSRRKVKVGKLGKNSTKDLFDDKKEDIFVVVNNKIKISKNRTDKFDSFFYSKKIAEIDLKNPKKDISFYGTKTKNFFKKHLWKIGISMNSKVNKKDYWLLNDSDLRQNDISACHSEFISESLTNATLSKDSDIYQSDIGEENKDYGLLNDSDIHQNDMEDNINNLIRKNKRKLNFYRIFRVFLFLVFICFILLGSKITIENCVTSGYENILALKNDFDNLDKARQNIKEARIKFFVANTLLMPISIIPNDNIQNITNLVSGGNDLSKLLLKSFNLYDKTTIFLNEKGGLENVYFTNLLEEIKGNYEDIYLLSYSSMTNFSKVGDLGDENLNAKLKFVNEKLKYGLVILEAINNNYDTLLSLLGHNSLRNYLVVFQNNDEIRPTGGFMGSVAVITLKNGKIEKIENDDIYAYEWEINKVYTDKDIAPEGLNKITQTFGIRDANYYPEFRDSSAVVKYFFDKIDYKLDGIIYINQNIVLDLLDKINGVDSKILGEKIERENFSLILSTLVEAKVFKVGTLGTPKQVLFDFGFELYNKLIEEKRFYDYANILLKHIQNRDIVFYSFNTEENSLLWKLGINGEVNFNEKLDFNYPVYTSIGGNKTDRYIEYRYDKFVDELPGTCSFKTKLEIYKSHHFSKFEEQRVSSLLDSYGVTNKRDILNIQGKGDNKSYVRVLIPKDTIVQTQNNQKVYEYENYKVVELYITTQNLETSRNSISYTILNPNCEKYSYKFFKQPGIRRYNINFSVFGEENKYSEIESDFIYKRDED